MSNEYGFCDYENLDRREFYNAMSTVKNSQKMTKRELLSEGKRILNRFHKYAKDGYCPGDICSGWDWPTMFAVFPYEVTRYHEIRDEYSRRRNLGLKAYQQQGKEQ